MAFSATDAALEGFRIGRHKPMVMLIWALASLGISLVSTVLMVTMFGGTMNQLMNMETQAESDPTAAIAMMGQVAALYILIIPIAIVVFSVFTAAVYRAVLRPSESSFAYLRLGMTELRLAVVLVALTVLSMIVTFAIVLLAGIFAGLLGAAAIGSGDGASFAGMMIVMVLIYIGLMVVLLGFWVKFSLAAPMTFAEGRIRIFESWNATKGHFWPLLGSYVLAGILGIVVSFLGGAISLALMAALGGASATDFASLMQGLEADYTSLGSFFSLAMIANMVISSFFSALTYAIFLAPPAVAYRDIVGVKNPSLADTFA